eukprot:XP_011513767.1 myosin regulatory light chain 2, atrial isoform isoform X4 [Homo sapiens]
MASRKAGTRGKVAATKQAQRGSSNVFSMFEQAQIQEFKEAFSCIDQNRDGIICKADLRETYSQLGKVSVPEEELDAMLQEGKGPINFTVFLTLFGEKLNGTDPEEAILSAFRMFDPSGKGVVNKDDQPFPAPWEPPYPPSLCSHSPAVSCSDPPHPPGSSSFS